MCRSGRKRQEDVRAARARCQWLADLHAETRHSKDKTAYWTDLARCKMQQMTEPAVMCGALERSCRPPTAPPARKLLGLVMKSRGCVIRVDSAALLPRLLGLCARQDEVVVRV